MANEPAPGFPLPTRSAQRHAEILAEQTHLAPLESVPQQQDDTPGQRIAATSPEGANREAGAVATRLGAAVARPTPAAAAAPEPSADDVFDEATRLSTRRRVPDRLRLPDGSIVELIEDRVYLGRRPPSSLSAAGVQLLSVPDASRTVSRQHAALTRVGDDWLIEDAASTNGVYLVMPDGEERGLAGIHPVTERFFLGDAELSFEKGKR